MTKDILQNLYDLQNLDSAEVHHDPAQAAGLRSIIPEAMLTNYDRARARGKRSIATLRNNVCTNCRMQVPLAVMFSLRRGIIQSCGNCGLYLYLPESQEPVLQQNETAPRKVKSRKNKSAA